MNLLAQLEAATRPAPAPTAVPRPAPTADVLAAASNARHARALGRYREAMHRKGWVTCGQVESYLGMRPNSSYTQLVKYEKAGIVRRKPRTPGIPILWNWIEGTYENLRLGGDKSKLESEARYRAATSDRWVTAREVSERIGILKSSALVILNRLKLEGKVFRRSKGRGYVWRWKE